MIHAAKSTFPGLAAGLSLFALVSCDRGFAPGCDEGDTTCVASPGVSTGTGGGSSGTGSGGTKPDSTSGGGTSAGQNWNPAYDTGAAIKTIARSDYVGTPDIQGGLARQLAFHVVDSSLHITASSDGANTATNNRETFYDLQILCTDSVVFEWDSKTDNGLFPNAVTTIDPLTVFEPKPLYLTVVKMPVIAKALRAHLTARRGSTFQVWVKARSGYRLAGNAVAIPEDSLPRLNIAQTRALLFSGAALKPIPSDPFRLQVP